MCCQRKRIEIIDKGNYGFFNCLKEIRRLDPSKLTEMGYILIPVDRCSQRCLQIAGKKRLSLSLHGSSLLYNWLLLNMHYIHSLNQVHGVDLCPITDFLCLLPPFHVQFLDQPLIPHHTFYYTNQSLDEYILITEVKLFLNALENNYPIFI